MYEGFDEGGDLGYAQGNPKTLNNDGKDKAFLVGIISLYIK